MKTTRQEKLADHLTEIDEDLLNTAYEIDDAEKLADYTRRKSSPFYKTPLFRRLTALAACLAITLTAVLTLPDFSPAQPTDNGATVTPTPEEEKIVLPPVRVGTKGHMNGSLSADVGTIEKIYSKTEAVARIRIGNWLDETEFYSYFEVEVVELYSGTLPKNFILQQFASSKVTISGFPVFTYGTEFILFLKTETRAPEEGCSYPDDNTYTIWGGHPAIFEVIETDSGDSYFVDRFHLIEKSEWTAKNYINHATIASTVKNALYQRDAEGQQYSAAYSGVYRVTDWVDYLEMLQNGGK